MNTKKFERPNIFKSSPTFEEEPDPSAKPPDGSCSQTGFGHFHKNSAPCGQHREEADRRGDILVIRAGSGIAGDMIAAGLLNLAGYTPNDLDDLLRALNLENLIGRVAMVERMVDGIQGQGLKLDLPQEHEHRNLKDMENFFSRISLGEAAKKLALKTFELLAEAEGQVHGLPPEEVHFHEVGALDSILDIGISAALLSELTPRQICCSPLPVCDGVISCQHGRLPSPAPAAMKLLTGIPVYGLPGNLGETVTPTALALLKASGAVFGPWPPMFIDHNVLVYGTKYFTGIANGAIFAIGHEYRPIGVPDFLETCR